MEEYEESYDYDNTTFSPQGRLYQVEYARETVKKGTTTIGLKFKNGVTLFSLRNIYSKLIENNNLNKIKQIDDNIGCTFCGLSADARILIDYAREIVQTNKILYNDKISIKNLIEQLCSYMNIYSRYDLVRPFGVILIIAGIDEKGNHLYATDPSGAFLEYKAICEGNKSSIVTRFLENKYKYNMNIDNILALGLQSLKKTTRKKIDGNNIEISIIEKNKPYRKLTLTEIKTMIKKL